jgi:hypothetical protein
MIISVRFQGKTHDLIEVLSRHLTGGELRKASVRSAALLTEIRHGHLRNMNLKVTASPDCSVLTVWPIAYSL